MKTLIPSRIGHAVRHNRVGWSAGETLPFRCAEVRDQRPTEAMGRILKMHDVRLFGAQLTQQSGNVCQPPDVSVRDSDRDAASSQCVYEARQ